MSSPAPLVQSRIGFAEAFAAALGEALVGTKDEVGELSFTVARCAIIAACRIARDEFGYQQLMDIAAADYPERAERFEVNYHLLSLTENHRIRLKVSADETTPVPSVTGLWPVAGWFEREAFDLFGVVFEDNADLRRILTDYGFEGHPLRKDFPLTGHIEVRYSEAEKRVVYEPVSLPQDFRNFDFLMPWEGAQYRLPGDEKASGEAPGAPTSVAASSAKVVAEAASGTPKTTDKPADTGAGPHADAAATKAGRRPAATKAKSAGGRRAGRAEPKPGRGK